MDDLIDLIPKFKEMDGEAIEILDITLEGSNGNYFADLKVVKRLY